MEADWEVEIGEGAPMIDIDWPGRIDLAASPDSAANLPEAQAFPPLATALARINRRPAALLTSKCDVWDVEDFDRDELDAPGTDTIASACYIDVVPFHRNRWHDPLLAIAWCRSVCDLIRELPLSSCRADLVVRRAIRVASTTDIDTSVEEKIPTAVTATSSADIDTSIKGEVPTAVTIYVMACGDTPDRAFTTLAAALETVVDCVLQVPTPEPSAQKLQ